MPLRLLLSFLICNSLLFSQYTVVFPTGVVTDADLGVVSYRASSTIVAAINSVQTTIQVQPGHGALFAVNNFVIIDSEKMLITSKATDVLTVARGFASTTAALHVINSPIVNATLPDYHNRMAAEMKAVQANVLVRGNNLSDVTNAATARTNIGAAPIASPTFTGTVTAPAFSGPLTGAVTGNASTATTAAALSADAADCPTNNAAGGVSATGAAQACINLPATYQSLDQDLTGISALAATPGLLARTGAGTFAVRTLIGTANEITIANGDGTSANPTLSLASTFDVSGKTSTKSMKAGTTLPGSCTAGDLFFDTDAPAGNNTYGCTIASAWALQSAGDMLKSENLLGLTNAATARTNLGVAIGTNVQAFDADLNSLSALAGTGLVARTAASTFLERMLTGTSNEITITNADGVSGNPTLALSSTFDISGKTSTKPIKTGTTVPGTCAAGQYFFDTDAAAGQNTFACTATNVWTLQGDGGGVGGGAPVNITITAGSTSGVITHNGGLANFHGFGLTCIEKTSASAGVVFVPATLSSMTANAATVNITSNANDIVCTAITSSGGGSGGAAPVTITISAGSTSGVITHNGALSNFHGIGLTCIEKTSASTGVVFFPVTLSSMTANAATVNITTNANDVVCTAITGSTGAGLEIKNATLFDPVTTDSGRVQFSFPTAVTITRVSCSVKAATSVTINLDERAEATPDTTGTSVLTSNLVCDTNSQASTTFSNAGIALRVPVALVITAVSGTPDTLRVAVEYTIP